MFDDEEDPGRENTTVEDTVPEIITMPSRFEKVQETGYIDVWWLYDDGGMLLYYIHVYSHVCSLLY